MMRVAAQLRRIAKALEQANRLKEEELRSEYPNSSLSLAKRRSRLVRIDTPSVKDWNEEFAKSQETVEE
jgi:hypothetical protein